MLCIFTSFYRCSSYLQTTINKNCVHKQQRRFNFRTRSQCRQNYARSVA